MKLGITYKLFLAILAAAVMSVAGMYLIMQWDIDRGFLRYVNTMEQRHMSLLAQSLSHPCRDHLLQAFTSTPASHDQPGSNSTSMLHRPACTNLKHW